MEWNLHTDLQQSVGFEAARPSARGEINYTRTTGPENEVPYVEALSHDLTEPAWQQGGQQSPPLTLFTPTPTPAFSFWNSKREEK